MKVEFKNACDQVCDLVNKSNGSLISVGNDKAKFLRLKIYKESELNEFEKNNNISLPKDYRYFLTKVGVCQLYKREFTNGIQFRKIEEISQYSEEIFEDIGSLFPKLLLIGHLSGGEEIGFNLTRDMDNNCLVFFPDEDREEWMESEGREWHSFEDWFTYIVNNNGEKMII